MSAVSPAYVRRWPWEMSTVRLLLLLLLLTCLAGVGQSVEDDDLENTPPHDDEAEATADPSLEEAIDPDAEPDTDAEAFEETDLPPAESSSGYENESTLIDNDGYGLRNSSDPTSEPEEEGLSPTIILVPVVLVVVIIGMIVSGIAMSRKWNQKMTASDGMNEAYANANSSEKVPMPMFDDDIPSVLELEMEDMEQWIEKQA